MLARLQINSKPRDVSLFSIKKQLYSTFKLQNTSSESLQIVKRESKIKILLCKSQQMSLSCFPAFQTFLDRFTAWWKHYVIIGCTQNLRHSPGSLNIFKMHSRIRPSGSQSTSQNKEWTKQLQSSALFSVYEKSFKVFLKPQTIHKHGHINHQEADYVWLKVNLQSKQKQDTPESKDKICVQFNCDSFTGQERRCGGEWVWFSAAGTGQWVWTVSAQVWPQTSGEQWVRPEGPFNCERPRMPR